MTMTSRERMLTALGNGRPDRLPCPEPYLLQFFRIRLIFLYDLPYTFSQNT